MVSSSDIYIYFCYTSTDHEGFTVKQMLVDFSWSIFEIKKQQTLGTGYLWFLAELSSAKHVKHAKRSTMGKKMW